MKIKRFIAQNFRNIASCDIRFSDGVNLLWGKNAQGKTNAIEGIYLFSRGRSFRSSAEKELVRFETDGFYLRAEYEDRDGDGSLEYTFLGGERKRQKNGYRIDRVSEMIGNFRAVLFCPDHLGLVKDGPEERRAFLNVGICSCDGAYIKYFADHKHALEQRNALLKFAQKGMPIDRRELLAWSESLAEYSSFLYSYRSEYIRRLDGYAREVLLDMTDGEDTLSLSYKSDIDAQEGTPREKIAALYRDVYTRDTEREIAAGVTLFGPGRDDLEISIGDRRARAFGSQGQQRSIVLALKSAEGEVIRERIGEYPVFLYDDVLSELDERRRRYVLNGSREKQIIITSCEKKEIADGAQRIIEVSGGQYVSAHR